MIGNKEPLAKRQNAEDQYNMLRTFNAGTPFKRKCIIIPKDKQYRSKSKAERETSNKNLADDYQQKVRYNNSMTPSVGSNTNTVVNPVANLKINFYDTIAKDMRIRPNSLLRGRKEKSKAKTQSSVKFQRQNIQLTNTLDRNKSGRLMKSFVRNRNNDFIVATNNSYIHNLNISNEFFYPATQKTNKEGILEVIEIELNKKITEAESHKRNKKELIIFEAHKEALESVIAAFPFLNSLLTRIKTSFEHFLDLTIKEYRREVAVTRSKIEGAAEVEMNKLKEEIKRLRQELDKPIIKKPVIKVPRLDLTKLRKSSDEELDDVPISPGHSSKKPQIPLLKLGEIKNEKYYNKYTDKEQEAWQEYKD